MWTDHETDIDFLNFSTVAETVAEIISQADGKPVSIGVSGAWGVGKSSMIRLIRRSFLTGTKEGRDFVFVEFNAWLYQGYDDARVALLDVIAETLQAEAETRKKGLDKSKEFLARVNWLRVGRIAGAFVGAALGLPPVGVAGEVIGALHGLKSGTLTTKQVENTAGSVADASVGLLAPRTTPSPPKEIQSIRNCFEETLRELDVTLVVLIDDLDRCLPETAISTLEAMRLFLFLENTAFVIAADNEMIRHAVRRHFAGFTEGQEHLVTSYFDKLIQVPIRVPPLGTQEVRAYLFLLFIENSALDAAQKEALRDAVCRHLGKSWTGARVDRAFMETTFHNLNLAMPDDLIRQFDTAERLAPLMTTSPEIKGNPRLIKRFLNAISIRLAIARAHGVEVDEAVLAKLLLLERCGTKAYEELVRRVHESSDGRPSFMHEWEEAATNHQTIEATPPWDTGFIHEWFALPPMLAALDLRGALYVSREHIPLITPGDKLSSAAAELLTALVDSPDMAAALRDKLSALSRTELEIIMSRLLQHARQVRQWGVPPILEACLAVAEFHGEISLAAFLKDLPAERLDSSIVPKIGDRPWAESVFEAWEKIADPKSTVRKAIGQFRKQHGDVTK